MSHHHAHNKSCSSPSNHFNGSSALDHVFQRRSANLLALNEGHYSDASRSLPILLSQLRQTAFLALLSLLLCHYTNISLQTIFYLLLGFSIYQACYTVWNAYQKLGRYHRLLDEEYHEIQNNHSEEKEELKALYQIKGIKEPLLTEVVDAIMADDEQALRVMLQEELGLVLNAFDHPLQQGLASTLGSLIPLSTMGILSILIPSASLLMSFLWIGLFLLMASLVKARFSQDNLLSAMVWNGSMAAFALGILTLLLR